MFLSRRAGRFAGIREQRNDGSLSQELFQVSQALILCGLPYQPTTERHFTRNARLADRSTVAVTFSTALEAAMPYGSDRTFLHFLMDRAVKTGSRFVSWETATEFLSTMNLATGERIGGISGNGSGGSPALRSVSTKDSGQLQRSGNARYWGVPPAYKHRRPRRD